MAKDRDTKLKEKREYYQRNKLRLRALNREYYKENKEVISKYKKKWKSENKARLATNQLVRYKSDINFKLTMVLRSRLRMALKKCLKTGSAVNDLGCSVEELKSFLQSKFEPGMTWDNWSKTGWHIDHRIPLKQFNLTDPIEFKQAVHFTNLQPMWADKNYTKGSKI